MIQQEIDQLSLKYKVLTAGLSASTAASGLLCLGQWLHPNAAGYRFIAAKIWPLLKTML